MAVLRRKIFFSLLVIFLGFICFTPVKGDQFENTSGLNSFGMPGAIDLPSAINLPDGQFSISSTAFGGTIRVNLSFQILENLTGAFRYARIPSATGDHRGYYWDRSFDLHYLLNKEKKIFPSIAIGVRDIIGTGIYSGEYVVSTKTFGSKLRISGGLGWGRLAGQNGFNNIFGNSTRGGRDFGRGGTFQVENLFSGDNSPFFSVSYKLNEKIELISEISPDDYSHETSSSKGFTRRSNLNLGVKYSFAPSFSILASFIHGDALGLTLNLGINPKDSPYKSGIEPAPMPILSTDLLSKDSKLEDDVFRESKRLLDLEGIELKDIQMSSTTIAIDIVNRQYINVSQMIGRVSRIFALTSPPNIKKFKINVIDHVSSLFISEVVIVREEFVANELIFNGSDLLWKSVSINNSEKKFLYNSERQSKKLSWSLYPYLETMLFDPHAPIRFSIGAELSGVYNFSPAFSVSGSLRQPIAGTMDDVKRGPKVGLPNVRSDFMYYHRDIASNLYINYLTLNHFLKPHPNLYATINVGILELMHAGIRSEVIWKQNKKPYGFGLDLAQVQKRGTKANFHLIDEYYNTLLASLYYDMPNDWIVKIDAGKYLAGDYGSTVSMKRTFNNGWEFGAYATLTDVPFSRFGEGSFEKGLTIKAPLSWFTGKKSRSVMNAVIRPITGDGGAKLNLSREKYIYDIVNEYDEKNISDNWKRVYR